MKYIDKSMSQRLDAANETIVKNASTNDFVGTRSFIKPSWLSRGSKWPVVLGGS